MRSQARDRGVAGIRKVRKGAERQTPLPRINEEFTKDKAPCKISAPRSIFIPISADPLPGTMSGREGERVRERGDGPGAVRGSVGAGVGLGGRSQSAPRIPSRVSFSLRCCVMSRINESRYLWVVFVLRWFPIERARAAFFWAHRDLGSCHFSGFRGASGRRHSAPNSKLSLSARKNK
jgi:hypothetical protein